MADWSLLGREWPPNQYEHPYPVYDPYYQEKEVQPVTPCLPSQAQSYPAPPSPMLTLLLSSPQQEMSPPTMQYINPSIARGDNPREIRNKAEKQRRDKLNHSIAELAAMVPPVVAAKRKIDKTGVLRLTAHYLRAHQYVFGDSIGHTTNDFCPASAQHLLGLLNGFLLTTTYRGLVVVVSQNVHEYLGYTELDLLGQNILNIIHEDDRRLLKEQLMPKIHMLGPNGELLFPDEPDGKEKVAEALAREKRSFVVRFKKLGQRSEPYQYVTCHVEGTFRKSDGACGGLTRCCQMIRRVRARGDNPCSSGNDVVFIGVVRPAVETFLNESNLESFKMEYRTRHSIDGEIIQCEQRIALVTGYMTHEVNGVNAMNFMHRDDVRWVVIALREMYDQHRLVGESCYRLMTKNGQFVYMRTRGRLDVDPSSGAVTSFVCTNTLVEEQEGKELIKLMKKRFNLMVNNNDNDPLPDEEDMQEEDNNSLPVENPRQLEKVILHLVTNLPSPQNEDSASPDRQSSLRLTIIPPRKEKIVSAIEKIYSVIKTFPKEFNNEEEKQKRNSIKCVDLIQDTVAPAALEFAEANENISEVDLKLNSNEVISANCDKSQSDQIPDNSIYLKHQTDFLYDNKIFFSEPDENLCAPGTSDIDFVAMQMVSQKVPEMNSTTYETDTVNSDKDIIPVPHVKYHLLINPQQYSVETICEDLKGDTFTPNQIAFETIRGGLKRTSDVVGQHFDMMTKKKPSDLKQTNKGEKESLAAGRDSPSLENFFDEAILNTQIETAINTLEQTIDPNFPDLLVSKEVQDILKEIEDLPDSEYQPDESTQIQNNS